MEGGDQLASLISGLHALRLVMIFSIASCAVFIWDYILTVRMEVDLVWKSKWTFMKGLYFFQRYLPFVDTTSLVLYLQLRRGLAKTACAKMYPLAAVSIMVGFAASEALLTLRTWAVWNRNQRLSIILPTLYVLVWGSGFVILGIYLNSVTFGDPPYPGFEGCFPAHSNEDYVFLWVQIITWDTLMLMLMLLPAVRAYRNGGNSALTKAVYYDGIIYYLYLFILSFVNILLAKILPFDYQHLLVLASIPLNARKPRPSSYSRTGGKQCWIGRWTDRTDTNQFSS